jgi:RNA polymerase sigma factor (sigma-70 family)
VENRTADHWHALLSGPDCGSAWGEFLRQYAALILSLARQFNVDEQDHSDCFIYACEQLSDNSFHRLRQWQPQDGVGFTAWLRVVVARLCTDFYRQRFGRSRPNRAAVEGGPLHERVFHLRFVRHYSLAESLETLRPDYPQLSEMELAGIITRLNRSLTPRQHWHLQLRQPGFVSLEGMETEASPSRETETALDAEQEASAGEQRARVQAAVRQLPAQDRLLLRLRYEQDLSFREIAELAGLRDSFQARYRIDKALQQLAILLSD